MRVRETEQDARKEEDLQEGRGQMQAGPRERLVQGAHRTHLTYRTLAEAARWAEVLRDYIKGTGSGTAANLTEV